MCISCLVGFKFFNIYLKTAFLTYKVKIEKYKLVIRSKLIFKLFSDLIFSPKRYNFTRTILEK